MATLGRRVRDDLDPLQQGPRKRYTASDPLVHVGRHFGRTVFAFCNVKSLLTNGLTLVADNPAPETLNTEERQIARVYRELLKISRTLEARILRSNSEEEVGLVADLIQRGANASRVDDTKGMKSSIIDWITPPGEALCPPLNRRTKSDRGFQHERTGSLLCPAGLDWNCPEICDKLRSGEMIVRGDQWPVFLYPDMMYDPDDPWQGLLRSPLLAYKHVFTSPSSVDDDEVRVTKSTKSGNARIHGMKSVTPSSLAYITTQVRFALTSASQFFRSDTITDSERFYLTLLETLEDVRERENVQDLLGWWNKKIFPHYSPDTIVAPVEGSVHHRIRQKRAELESRSQGANGD
ncbi:hypothetical protein Hypma_000280 [Hypsizygus marmoreus]|uniref:Uncharacterized protein n=1 Tax=Hypsizygus marmoreus TaxID=39966 RepID=A0A369J919_HYPMA|nr:hypothetical protein Hypma_000280 [Hypsizygus marmoreus]